VTFWLCSLENMNSVRSGLIQRSLTCVNSVPFHSLKPGAALPAADFFLDLRVLHGIEPRDVGGGLRHLDVRVVLLRLPHDESGRHADAARHRGDREGADSCIWSICARRSDAIRLDLM